VPTTINGRSLGVAQNGIFTSANTDPIPGGLLWETHSVIGAAESWMDMRAAAILDGVPPEEFAPGGPASSARSYAQQVALKREWTAAGHPERAATPGTSNHGWGIAVDCPSGRAQAWMRQHAHRFGWSNAEGRRVGEPWHWGYVGGYRPKIDRLSGYRSDEVRWIRELDKLTRKKRKSARDTQRVRVLRRVLTERRKAIWHAAQRTGWQIGLRRKRYNSLLARTT
jgi:hypothetical protein